MNLLPCQVRTGGVRVGVSAVCRISPVTKKKKKIKVTYNFRTVFVRNEWFARNNEKKKSKLKKKNPIRPDSEDRPTYFSGPVCARKVILPFYDYFFKRTKTNGRRRRRRCVAYVEL